MKCESQDNFECFKTFQAHSCVLALVNSESYLISGGSDNVTIVWDFSEPFVSTLAYNDTASVDEKMLKSLDQLIRFASISGNHAYSRQCLRCANYLKTLFIEHGAESFIVSITNPA